MKLRIRHSGETQRLTLEETASIEDLKILIARNFNLESDFLMSLNGSEELECDPSSVLQELDIVHGDLIHVLVPSPPPQESQTEKRTPPQATNSGGNITNNSTEPKPPEAEYKHLHESPPQASNSESREESFDEDAIQDSQVNRYLREPMLVCESSPGSVPQILERVYENAQVCTAGEAVCVALHVLMSESGFNVCEGNAAAKPDLIQCPWMPNGWRSQTSYRLTYSHQSCPGVTFTVLCVSMGTLLIVHGKASGVSVEEKCQCQLDPRDYVLCVDPDAGKTFKNLGKLSRLFKDKVAYCLLELCRQAQGEVSLNGLPGLIEEVKFHVLTRLDARSLARMARVNKDFNRIAKQPQLWRRLYLRDFGRRTHMELQQDWYKLYRDKHVLRREMRERMSQARFVVPPFIERRDPPFPFTPIYPPGFIGGDYDRFPAIPGLPGSSGLGPVPPPRPRFDPFGPLPDNFLQPGRGGATFHRPRPRNPFGGGGGGFGGFF